jgi:hypothetical protein
MTLNLTLTILRRRSSKNSSKTKGQSNLKYMKTRLVKGRKIPKKRRQGKPTQTINAH